jgi:chemotaxis protein methyltransferase WspC
MRAMGLNPSSVGRYSIARAMRERMAALGLEQQEAYARLAQTSLPELMDLLEAVAVAETWFFRNPQAFTEMVRCIRAMSPPGSEPTRILSVPCSNGEEPYSIAMAMLDAGFAPSRFRIDAFDVSARALALAREALYGRNSFRSKDLDFRARHFTLTDEGYRLNETVREAVVFGRANVLGAGFLQGVEPYDVIFCRNMLVYFDVAAQERAIAALRRALKPDGLLFVGPAEAGLLFRHDFVWSKVPLAFCFRPGNAVQDKPAPARAVGQATPRHGTAPKPQAQLPLEGARVPAPRKRAPGLASATAALDEAARAADLGYLLDAAKACDLSIRVHGASPRALHLRGLICQASGDAPGAEAYFRKVLFLEPTHVEALLHLALLLERRRDLGEARLLRDRLRRLPARDLRSVR